MSPTQCYDTSRSIQLALSVSSGLYYLLGRLTVINTAARTDRKFTGELTCCASSGSYLRNQPCLKVPHYIPDPNIGTTMRQPLHTADS